MVKTRLIPTLLLKDARMIKTRQFGTHRDVGNPVTVAKVYDAQRADELIFLDVTATTERRQFLMDVIQKVAEVCFLPITAGGGIRSVEDARHVLARGADKIAVNSIAAENPALIAELAENFGASAIVVSIDFKKNSAGRNEVFTHRGTKATGFAPVEWAREAEARGAGEILLTSIERDGMMEGYDIEEIRKVSSIVSIPVIASGGVGTVQDLVDGIRSGGASAVAAASIFHFTDQSIFKAHSHMKEMGLLVRQR